MQLRAIQFTRLFLLFLLLPLRSAVAEQPAGHAPSAAKGHTSRSAAHPFIFIHLDGVSSRHFLAELEAGRLPHLQKAFAGHGIIEHALTYLPSKTPTVISSLSRGIPVNESRLVSWVGVDRETDKVYTLLQTFRWMVASKPRIAATNLIYGIPRLDGLAGPALVNLPDLLDDYPVLEFYWYPVDTAGHFFGEETYLRKLRNFDRSFGKLMKRLEEEYGKEVNIVIYSDHGMTFGEGFRIERDLEWLNDNVRAISYPNLFVQDPESIPDLAREIVERSPVDYTFYRSGENQITGIHETGMVRIESDGESGLRYLFEGEDLFGYYQSGYRGEYWNSDKWLEFSWDKPYPAAPVNLYNFLLNPGVGDILLFLDKDRYSQTGYSREGNHGGITSQDIHIPILLRGPDLEHLYGRKTLWLQDLVPEIGEVPFRTTPARDRHTLSGWTGTGGSSIRLTASPHYRWLVGAQTTFEPDRELNFFRGWVQFDLIRGYLARFWIGGGVEADRDRLRPMVLFHHEVRYRKVSARNILSTTGNHEFALEFRLTDLLSLQFVNFRSAGLRFDF